MSIFISYSRVDTDFVDLLQRLLVSKGYEAWLDRRDIGAGSRWDAAIEQALRSRTHVVVVLSPEAVASENVSDEWSFALEEGKTVIPLYYRPCSIPMRLRRLQGIDFEKQQFAEAFRVLTDTLGDPDNRPGDPIELARREGLIFVEMTYSLDLEPTRIAFVYSDYPLVKTFLSKVWFTLLWRVVDQYTYGTSWFVEDKITEQAYLPPECADIATLLLHEIGIEPGALLEIKLIKGEES